MCPGCYDYDHNYNFRRVGLRDGRSAIVGIPYLYLVIWTYLLTDAVGVMKRVPPLYMPICTRFAMMMIWLALAVRRVMGSSLSAIQLAINSALRPSASAYLTQSAVV